MRKNLLCGVVEMSFDRKAKGDRDSMIERCTCCCKMSVLCKFAMNAVESQVYDVQIGPVT